MSLSRETLVDEATIAQTRDRRAYAQALLTFVVPAARPAMAATPFFTRRHLGHRIALIAREKPMSRSGVVMSLVTAAAAVTVVTVFTAGQVPFASVHAAPHIVPPRLVAWTQTTEPVRPGGDVTVPRVVHDEKPAYTEAALAARIQGAVRLDVVVLESGAVGRVEVVESLDKEYGLDEAAAAAASRWTFEPGKRGDTPVPVIVTLEMRFTLKD